ncbi:MAG: endonuclease domain-containing protein [Solirubrobacteraceae bacterium]
MAAQQGVCAICKQPETATHQTGWVRRLSVDHDHACCPGNRSCGNCVRGLLCSRCNNVLGSMRDSVELIDAMSLYLRTCASLSAVGVARSPAPWGL